MTLEEYLRSIDPEYGSQAHQREFLARMARAEAAHPCTRDHSGDKPPTHRAACYRTPRGRALPAPTPEKSGGAEAEAKNKPPASRVG